MRCLESSFTTLWEKTRLLVPGAHTDHLELPDTRITAYARGTDRLDLILGDLIPGAFLLFSLYVSRRHVHC